MNSSEFSWFVFDAIVYKNDVYYLDKIEDVTLSTAGSSFESLLITTLTLLTEERIQDTSIVLKVLITDFKNPPIIHKFVKHYKDGIPNINEIIDILGNSFGISSKQLRKFKFECSLLGYNFNSYKNDVAHNIYDVLGVLCNNKYRLKESHKKDYMDIFNIYLLDNDKLKIIFDLLIEKNKLSNFNFYRGEN